MASLIPELSLNGISSMETTDTIIISYWLNWRVLACAIWVLLGMALSAVLIWRYEGDRNRNGPGCVYEDEVWGTCSRSVAPIWLLGYRLVAFVILLALLLADAIASRAQNFNYYTQWTFALVTIYFGLGSSLSIHGWLHYYSHPKLELKKYELANESSSNCRMSASGWGYAFQILFQMCAGAVVLTDLVYWLIIYPFLVARNIQNLTFLAVCMHSVNAVLLLGDAILNRLRFPFFRVAYFILFTAVCVIIEWIIHACSSVSWPYDFMDLSSPYAPFCYVAMGLLLFPCFGIFSFVFLIKNRCLSSCKKMKTV
ncbi:uncharacterized protein LOC127241348 isoform X2 [Andrographis paniculata]|uniref:uncharacterized protein LOC127241348 isoform X2 n=1 Tax=Andrographis paniculata TaxID=175694 RepID=UPI0021E8710A|nr:uncharacterized protein LOC127241348 isoform X2 [Andrographis paniculata]